MVDEYTIWGSSPVWPIKKRGNLGYLPGSWREATSHFIVISDKKEIRKKKNHDGFSIGCEFIRYQNL